MSFDEYEGCEVILRGSDNFAVQEAVHLQKKKLTWISPVASTCKVSGRCRWISSPVSTGSWRRNEWVGMAGGSFCALDHTTTPCLDSASTTTFSRGCKQSCSISPFSLSINNCNNLQITMPLHRLDPLVSGKLTQHMLCGRRK